MAGMTEIRAGMTEIGAGMTEIRAGMTEIGAGMTEIRAGMTEIRAGMTINVVVRHRNDFRFAYLVGRQLSDWEKGAEWISPV